MAVVKVLSTMAYARSNQNHGVPILELENGQLPILGWENGQPFEEAQIFEPLPKRKKTDVSTFEELILRFPHLGEAIFDNLDDKRVTKCVEVNETLQNFIYEQKSYWIRKIKCFFGRNILFRNEWLRVLKRPSLKIAKLMFLAIQHLKGHVENNDHLHFHLNYFHPHHIAIRTNSVILLEYMIEKTNQINPVYPGAIGSTPLHDAANFGQFETFRLIMESSVRDKNPRCKLGNTPLHAAAKMGYYNICALIIRNVTDKNPRNNDGVTPLGTAASNGHLDICELITNNVSDKNPACNLGLTPLHNAAHNGHFEICKLLTK